MNTVAYHIKLGMFHTLPPGYRMVRTGFVRNGDIVYYPQLDVYEPVLGLAGSRVSDHSSYVQYFRKIPNRRKSCKTKS